MSNSYHKNLVFTAACIGMCFFGVSMITLGAVLPSLIAKLNLSGLQTTSLVTFLPLGMLAGSLIFGPIVDRFGHKALLVPSCIIVLLGMEGLAFFEACHCCKLPSSASAWAEASSTEKPMHWYPTSQENPKRLTPQFSGHVLRTGRIGHTDVAGLPFQALFIRNHLAGNWRSDACGHYILYPRTLPRP